MERWATSTPPPANAVGSSSPRARERGVPSTGRATPPCCVSLRTSCSSRAGVMWNTLAKEPCNARSNCRAWSAERTASSGASPAWTESCYIRHFFPSHYHEAVVAGPGGDLRIGGIPLSLRDIHAIGVLVRRNVSALLAQNPCSRWCRTPNFCGKALPCATTSFLVSGAPGETRTPDLLVRSQPLYPPELRARNHLDSSSPYPSATTGFTSSPSPSTRTTISSPGFSQRGGLRANLTPPGVPVERSSA